MSAPIDGPALDASRAAPATGDPRGAAPNARKPRRGDEVTLRIESFDARGRGRAGHAEHAWSVPRALPGALVRVRVVRRRRAQVDASMLAVLEPGADVRDARCAHFGGCGGCSFQSLDYSAQLAGKQRLVESAFAHHSLLAHARVEPVLAARETWHYRNKMEFTFSNRRWIDPREPAEAPRADFALGLHATGLYTKVVDVQACAIQDPRADAILASARELALERRIAPWDVRTHTGILRHLVLRTARATGEILVNLVTSAAPAELVDEYARALLARHPEITTLVHVVNTRAASTATGEEERVIHGRGYLLERLGGLTFAISPQSFFQTNTAQAEQLLELVREACALSGAETVHDLYCGTGSIALNLAHAAREVVGIEQVASAIADAERNARLNAIGNVRFVAGDVLEVLRGDPFGRADVCVVDPPRAGLHPRLIPRLIELAPRRLVYVSCNPASAARDLEALTAGAYRIERIRPVDLFPHTPHVECVVGLVRAPEPVP